MYHLDKPGGPSRLRPLDLSRQEWGEPVDAPSSSRVEEGSCSIASKSDSHSESERSWGQTMYDVGLYGSVLGIAYRLLRPTTPQTVTTARTDKAPDRSRSRPGQRKNQDQEESGPTTQGSQAELQAALDEALTSSITPSSPSKEIEDIEILEPETPLRPLAQWSQNNPGHRRRRNDPSRLSRVSYISTMSTQSSIFSSIDSEWDGHRDRDGESTPETLYILTPPALFVELSSNGRDAKFVEPKTPTRMIGLGLSLEGEEEDEEGDETTERLDALLARVKELTSDGMRALGTGPTRIHAGLPGKAASRRKLHTSLD